MYICLCMSAMSLKKTYDNEAYSKDTKYSAKHFFSYDAEVVANSTLKNERGHLIFVEYLRPIEYFPGFAGVMLYTFDWSRPDRICIGFRPYILQCRDFPNQF